MNKDDIKRKIRQRRKTITTQVKVSQKKKNNMFVIGCYKFLICIIIFLFLMIGGKENSDFKSLIRLNVIDKNMSFMWFNNLYTTYLGDIIPFNNIFDNDITTAVFSENLVYSNKTLYKDGVTLDVTNEYLVPLLESGLVVFIGTKEGYGQTIIVQGIDGVDIWYSDVINSNIKLYDYVSKGNPLGQTSNNKLTLVFNKEGEFLDYNEFIEES